MKNMVRGWRLDGCSTLEWMQTGKASKTALRVGIRRAAHQVIDNPRVLDDPVAVRLLGAGFARDLERAMHPVARDFRAFMAARSRYVEDQLAKAVANGVNQYVILGAGLDTFAYRNPFPTLLQEAGIAPPASLTFVPLDFEHTALVDGLAEAGFSDRDAAFFGWLGVVPYLTLDAFRATLQAVALLPTGTGISFDYAFAPETLSAKRQQIFKALSERVAAAGEPFKLFFTPEQMESELRRAGFKNIEQWDSAHLNELYFRDRSDGLRLSDARLGMLVTAWV
jgi:O-methyltransferase involved in polyketide biosynthesis